MNKKKVLYPIRGLITVFIVMFIRGLNRTVSICTTKEVIMRVAHISPDQLVESN